MADVIDYLRALNAPPALGIYSAAKAQPYLNTGIGTGGGMQLVMKDQQGIGQAASNWARARMQTEDPYAGLIWGDSIGQAQQTLLNERARRVQEALAREQMDMARDREARIYRQAEADRARLAENDRLDFQAQLAQALSRGRTTNAQALENLSRMRLLASSGDALTRDRAQAEADLRALESAMFSRANRAVSGNPDAAIRFRSSGLPEVYSPTDRLDANVMRQIEEATYEGGARDQYENLLARLSELDSAYKNWSTDSAFAFRQPTAQVDLSPIENLLAGRSPTVAQSAAQILDQARARGAAYRLPPTVPAPRRWTFDPQTRRVL